MPKIKNGIKYSKRYEEQTVVEAIDDVLKNNISKKAASKMYSISRSTLQFRLSKRFKKIGHGPPSVLLMEEENVLVEWLF